MIKGANIDCEPRPTGAGLSVVIPVFNSSATLPNLVQELEPVLAEIGERYEVLLINDGSWDDSWNVIRKLTQQYEWVRGVNLMRNYGQHNALLCGVRIARYSATITMDDDLQHSPHDLPKLLAKLADGYDLVYANPVQLPHSRLRNWLSRLTKKLLARATGIGMIEQQAPFRAFRTDLRKAFRDYRSSDVLLDVLLSWGAKQIGTVTVDYAPRRHGTSNYNSRRLIRMSALLVTSYSTAPLRLASIIGFLFTLFGFFILGYVLLTYLLRGSLPGFPFLASIIAIFGGAQLFTLGVFGEYLARIYRRSLDRPPYVLDEIVAQEIEEEQLSATP